MNSTDTMPTGFGMSQREDDHAADDPVRLLARVGAVTRATDADVARLRRAVPRSPAPVRSRWRVAAPAAVGMAAMAATSLMFVPPPTPEPPPAAPLSVTFDGSVQGPVQAAPGVSLAISGKGKLSGTQQAPVLDWQRGRVDVEVTPGAGIDFRLKTQDGVVHVIGTAFSVERDALGTHVDVTRGKVEVGCAAEAVPKLLTADMTTTCWPTTAGGLLGRARALHKSGAPPDAVLNTVSVGLNTADPASAIGRELAVLEVQQLVSAARTEEAIPAALAYLDSGAALRRPEVARLGASIVTDASGCESARRFLTVVEESGTLPPDLAPLAARCGD